MWERQCEHLEDLDCHVFFGKRQLHDSLQRLPRTYIEDTAFDSWADPHPGSITQTILTEKEGEVARNRMPVRKQVSIFQAILEKNKFCRLVLLAHE